VLVQETKDPDGAGDEDREPAEDDVAAPAAQADAQRAEEQPRRAEDHHLPPGVHRRLRGLGGRERRVEARRQPGHVRLRTKVELADVDAGQALLRPEGLAVDDDAPGVEVLDGEIGEERDAGPERHRTEELAAEFGGGSRCQIAGQQYGGDQRAKERARREAYVVEPAVSPGRGAFGRGADEGEDQSGEPDHEGDALRTGFGEDRHESGDREAEGGGDRPEHHPAPAPRSQRQDEAREDHHGAFTGGELGLGGGHEEDELAA